MIPFDTDYAISILPILMRAAIITIEATVSSFAVALVVGLLLALALRSRSPFVVWPVAVVVQFIRSTPLLVQLYFLFFILPTFGVTLPPFSRV